MAHGRRGHIIGDAMPLGVNKVALHDLAERGIVVRGKRRGCYAVEAACSGTIDDTPGKRGPKSTRDRIACSWRR